MNSDTPTTSATSEYLKIDQTQMFIRQLIALGVFEFSGFGVCVKLYPDGTSAKNIDIPLPSAKEAAKDAIEAAKREMAEEDKNTYWSAG